jgi:non-canonical purine NTP pyrophosphatase (RdgB/HAM1 family)
LQIINFVTGNKDKLASMKEHIVEFGFDALQAALPLIEPQASSIEAVALSKAVQAFKVLQEPVVVEDSGFCIDGLSGFPGPYTKYVLDTIGAAGLLRLAEPLASKTCKFVSVLTYIDLEGEPHTFVDQGMGTLAMEVDTTSSEQIWSDLWRIFIPDGKSKAFTALTLNEQTNLWKKWQANSVYTQFAEWLSAR